MQTSTSLKCDKVHILNWIYFLHPFWYFHSLKRHSNTISTLCYGQYNQTNDVLYSGYSHSLIILLVPSKTLVWHAMHCKKTKLKSKTCTSTDRRSIWWWKSLEHRNLFSFLTASFKNQLEKLNSVINWAVISFYCLARGSEWGYFDNTKFFLAL